VQVPPTLIYVCCGVLRCVAVCCGVLQCVALWEKSCEFRSYNCAGSAAVVYRYVARIFEHMNIRIPTQNVSKRNSKKHKHIMLMRMQLYMYEKYICIYT